MYICVYVYVCMYVSYIYMFPVNWQMDRVPAGSMSKTRGIFHTCNTRLLYFWCFCQKIAVFLIFWSQNYCIFAFTRPWAAAFRCQIFSHSIKWRKEMSRKRREVGRHACQNLSETSILSLSFSMYICRFINVYVYLFAHVYTKIHIYVYRYMHPHNIL